MFDIIHRRAVISTIMSIGLFSAATGCWAATSVSVGFSPYGDAHSMVMAIINDAHSSIDMVTYSFTSKPIAVALSNAQKRGVIVRVVADREQSEKSYSATQFLSNRRVPVRLNGNYPALHSKFLVIDGSNVETGSFNFTAAARKNVENVLVIRDAPGIAKVYAQEFERLWAEGYELKGNY